MENAGVGCGRSWQSMKEHFRKSIFVKIKSNVFTYGLTKSKIMSFRVGMGEEAEALSSSTSKETKEEVQARHKTDANICRKKFRKKVTPRLKNRASNDISSPVMDVFK